MRKAVRDCAEITFRPFCRQTSMDSVHWTCHTAVLDRIGRCMVGRVRHGPSKSLAGWASLVDHNAFGPPRQFGTLYNVAKSLRSYVKSNLILHLSLFLSVEQTDLVAVDRSPDLFAHRFYVLVLFFSLLVIPTCGRLSWPALWSTFARAIKYCFID